MAQPALRGMHAPAWRVPAAVAGTAVGSRACFWATAVLASLLVWAAPHPPMADLPQHAAQITLLADLLQGRSAWGDLVTIQPFTPYLIGYALALPLVAVMPVAAAVKVLLTLALLAFAACFVLVRRQHGADPRLDWLALPGFFGFAFSWGFLTFLLAAPVGLLFLFLAERHAVRLTRGSAAALTACGVALFFSHGLMFAFGMACAIAQFAAGRDRLRVLHRTVLPLLPLCGLALAYAAARPVALEEGPAVAWEAWSSRLLMLHHVVGDTMGSLPEAAGVAVAALALLSAPRWLGLEVQRRPAAWAPLVVLALVWLAAPFYAMGTTFVYPRFALFLLPFYALLFRAGDAARAPRAGAPGGALLLLACWALLLVHGQRIARFADEATAFEAARATLAPRQRALYFPLDAASPAARHRNAYENHALWYQAENGGLVDFNFAATRAQLVRYRPEHAPAVRLFWQPRGFDWTRDRGWLYRYFIVRHREPLAPDAFAGGPCTVTRRHAANGWTVFELSHCKEAP